LTTTLPIIRVSLEYYYNRRDVCIFIEKKQSKGKAIFGLIA